jgi:hypothetical protein
MAQDDQLQSRKRHPQALVTPNPDDQYLDQLPWGKKL